LYPFFFECIGIEPSRVRTPLQLRLPVHNLSLFAVVAVGHRAPFLLSRSCRKIVVADQNYFFFFAFGKKTATKVNRKLCQRRGTRGKKKSKNLSPVHFTFSIFYFPFPFSHLRFPFPFDAILYPTGLACIICLSKQRLEFTVIPH